MTETYTKKKKGKKYSDHLWCWTSSKAKQEYIYTCLDVRDVVTVDV